MGAPLDHVLCTVYFWLLVSVVDPVVTVTNPSVAPAGTVAVMNVVPESEAFVTCAPLNFTTEDLVNPWPKIPTCVPTLPEVVSSVTKGATPMSKLKKTPQPSPEQTVWSPPCTVKP